MRNEKRNMIEMSYWLQIPIFNLRSQGYRTAYSNINQILKTELFKYYRKISIIIFIELSPNIYVN